MLVEPDAIRLGGVYEVAALLGVSRPALADRRRAADPAFPAPLAELRCGPIWNLDDVDRYAAERRRRFNVA